MIDITQITAPDDSTHFAAKSDSAKLWMRNVLGRDRVFFDSSSDPDAKAFVAAAEAQGFSIEEMSPMDV